MGEGGKRGCICHVAQAAKHHKSHSNKQTLLEIYFGALYIECRPTFLCLLLKGAPPECDLSCLFLFTPPFPSYLVRYKPSK